MKMPLSRAVCAAQGHDHKPYLFLPWVWRARFSALVREVQAQLTCG
jgi:hypothetical protein